MCEFKVGDRISKRYVSDNSIYNGMVATVLDIWEINYYPNGDYSVIEKKPQAHIRYDNGHEMLVILTNEYVCGIVSPWIKVE